jgi:hypothetical protein
MFPVFPIPRHLLTAGKKLALNRVCQRNIPADRTNLSATSDHFILYHSYCHENSVEYIYCLPGKPAPNCVSLYYIIILKLAAYYTAHRVKRS